MQAATKKAAVEKVAAEAEKAEKAAAEVVAVKKEAAEKKAKEAAEALKVTADSLNDLGVIDRILKEPVGGAHRERDLIIDQVGDAVIEELDDLSQLSSDELRRDRRQKFLDMGRQGLA